MKYRTSVKILTCTSAFLCSSSFSMAFWFLERGAILPAVLDFAAALFTLTGTIYGVWWLCKGRRN